MNSKLKRQIAAYNTALEYCRIYGLPKENIVPKVKRARWTWNRNRVYLTGYYVLDATGTTTVKTILF